MEYLPFSVTAKEARNNAAKLAMCLRDNEDARVGETKRMAVYCGMCGKTHEDGLLLIHVHEGEIVGIGPVACRRMLHERLNYHRDREVNGDHQEKKLRLQRLDTALERTLKH
ncbi:MAG: hypothetical protein IT428_02835 [Planctomycetaceae bacterium]|nr:hypothetical protein [Planctomycetaceae bacterium]